MAKEENGISYETMKYVESLRHPRQVSDSTRVKFPCCKTKIGNIAFSENDRAITEAEQELGIGMTIYFRQMKFFALVFLIMSFVSIPSFILFNSSEGIGGGSIFFKMSLANLGQSDIACGSTTM